MRRLLTQVAHIDTQSATISPGEMRGVVAYMDKHCSSQGKDLAKSLFLVWREEYKNAFQVCPGTNPAEGGSHS